MSPEAQALVVEGLTAPPLSDKYPFATMEVGQCFVVPFTDEDAQLMSNRLRSAATQASKRRGMIFKVIKHAETNIIEVARIL